MQINKIDAVINCAGFGISGAVEFTSTDQAKAQFDVNFFGTVNVNKAVLPFMRHQGNGHIINISSVAAVAHIPFQTFYSLLCKILPAAVREKIVEKVYG